MIKLHTLSDVVGDVVDNGKLLLIQPGGNHGDSLIVHGASTLFADLGVETVRFRSARFRSDQPRQFSPFPRTRLRELYPVLQDQLRYLFRSRRDDISAVYIHGGGNFNDLWGNGVRCYSAISRYFDGPILVGPQSCLFEDTDVSSIFAGVSNETHFFCREEYSRDLLADQLRGTDVDVTLYCEHDTALYLDREDLPVRSSGPAYTLAALRSDKESARPTIDQQLSPPIAINDISVNADTYEEFVNRGARARKIYTDRLHGAILGALLETPVRFYENAYHKNRGVYEYSLSNTDHVTLVSDHVSDTGDRLIRGQGTAPVAGSR